MLSVPLTSMPGRGVSTLKRVWIYLLGKGKACLLFLIVWLDLAHFNIR